MKLRNILTNRSLQNRDTENIPQAIVVTEITDLSNYYGKFVKISIEKLRSYNRKHKVLTELSYYTLRGDIRLLIESISPITVKEYEQNHCIYGILRRGSNANFKLTNACIKLSNKNLNIIANALKTLAKFEYTTNADGSISIFNFTSESVENLIIPKSIDNKIVTAISACAFAGNMDIKTVKLPDTIKQLDIDAFASCCNLESVDLGDGIERINTTFSCCGNLKHLHIGKALFDFNELFSLNQKNISITIDPENPHLCIIDDVIFSKNKKILYYYPRNKKGKFDIPYGTVIIGQGAFRKTMLEEINVPNSVEKIESEAFYYADNLKKLSIPNSVIDMDYDAITGIFSDFGWQYKGEIIVEQDSYAHTYFQKFDDEFNLNIVVIDKHQINNATLLNIDCEIEKLFCRYCGHQLPLDSEFCFKCGTKVIKDNS